MAENLPIDFSHPAVKVNPLYNSCRAFKITVWFRNMWYMSLPSQFMLTPTDMCCDSRGSDKAPSIDSSFNTCAYCDDTGHPIHRQPLFGRNYDGISPYLHHTAAFARRCVLLGVMGSPNWILLSFSHGMVCYDPSRRTVLQLLTCVQE
jgi:hypothetical protein